MQIEWDERPGADNRRASKTWQLFLRLCSVCGSPFKTEFEHHECCPECVAIFREATR